MPKKGYKQTKEHRENSSESHKGKTTWNKGLKGICLNTGRTHFKKGSSGFSNDKHSLETRKKISKKNSKQGWIDIRGYKCFSYLGKEYKEHQVNWMDAHGLGFIPEGWLVHHRNLDRLDNRPENLLLMPRGLHTMAHAKLRRGEL